MIVVLTTDAVLDANRAKGALEEAVRGTFNRVDSDGCMSTNDIVLLMASGASGVTPEPDEFEEALGEACASLSRAVVEDAEGASHDIAITVKGATSEKAAEEVARAIARSNLFKAAIFGNDPNWGRIRRCRRDRSHRCRALRSPPHGCLDQRHPGVQEPSRRARTDPS